jgi:hypothetical protein
MGEGGRLAQLKAHGDQYSEAAREALKEAAEMISPGKDFQGFLKEKAAALDRSLRRRGMTRDFVSFSLFVGESLSCALRTGDDLRYLRDANGDFRYSIERGSETVFSAGTVGTCDSGGPMAIWQEYDRHPKPYISARIHGKNFHLTDGQGALVEPYYVFLARSNRTVPPSAFEFTARAVHAAGRLDLLRKEEITDAAYRLAKPYVELL